MIRMLYIGSLYRGNTFWRDKLPPKGDSVNGEAIVRQW
jgi:hypothetical protein